MDLDRLSAITPPAPDDDARARALAAAMAAFDGAEENVAAPQGNGNRPRHSGILNLIGRLTMNARLLATSALATLLIVPAAGWLTVRIVNERTGAVIETAGPVKGGDPAKIGQAETTTITALPKPVNPEPAEGAPEQPAVNEMASQTSVKPATLARREKKAPVDLSAAAPAEADAIAEVLPGRLAADAEMQATSEAPIVGEPGAELSGKPARSQELASGDRFSDKPVNSVKTVLAEPVSTFSIDVDTASYAYMRQALTGGRLPETDSVRVEELVNYFPYDWQGPATAEEAFRANVTVMPTPWNEGTQLMHVAIKGFETTTAEKPPANLVFLIDVSGSMDEPGKLPLLKSAFRLLVGTLRPDDTVSIVTYAGNSGVVLEPTRAANRQTILDAIDRLEPGGSTAGAAGIETAYQLARKAFVANGVNRVMLATDGDFNVGPSSDDDLKALIEEKRKSGIFLSVLGFGTGNYNDALMQTLAQNGNGTAAYIDTLGEAQKTLVEEATSSLFPIAKDVKIQVEFNPARIAEYRLIGYETRALNREDFNNDRVDAGEIGSGHRVTAIYEITPKGSPAVLTDDLRYGEQKPDADAGQPGGELAFVKIRYKSPDAAKSRLVTMPVTDANVVANDGVAADVGFSVAVAAFGQKLKDDPALGDFGYDRIVELATRTRGTDPFGYRAEFITLVRLADGLTGE